MNSNEKVRGLIKDWLEYTKKNNIKTPEDTDLKTFLLQKGYDGNLVTQLVAELPEKFPIDNKNDQYGNSSKEDLSLQDMEKLRKFNHIIRTQLNKKQLQMLKKEISKSAAANPWAAQ